jgi:hypothetical protein
MRVILEPKKHIYTDNRGQVYRSVSSIIAQYKHPFDPYKPAANGKTILENYVEKNGQTEQYWLDTWEAKKDYACIKGHVFHDLKEMVMNGRGVHRTELMDLPVQNVNRLWQMPNHEGNFHLLPPGVYTELCLWTYQYKIAGTADIITIYPDKTFDVDDYKTNGEFKTEGFRGAVMKYPCTNLPDCHLGHYTLQLSLYAWMITQFGFKPRKLRLHHYDIPPKDAERIIKEGVLPDVVPTIHEVVYAEKEVAIVMEQRALELRKLKRK